MRKGERRGLMGGKGFMSRVRIRLGFIIFN